MGYISNELRHILKEQEIGRLRNKFNNIENSITPSGDPAFRKYVIGQHMLSLFAESISTHEIASDYYEPVSKAEDEYLPSFPPMSPITKSHFVSWALLDVTFGKDKETICSCLVEMAGRFGITDEMKSILENMRHSRLGIYEHYGTCRIGSVLRELLTGKTMQCYIGSGYRGREGEIWLARVMPPVTQATHCVVFATPYIIVGSTASDWVHFLNRTTIGLTAPVEEKLCNLMKFGKSINYWNEYIFEAYSDFCSDAVYLTGFPDVQGSRPHAEEKNG